MLTTVLEDLADASVAPSPNRYLAGNFGPVASETTAFELPVHGQIPAELTGRLLRIGPNPLAPDPLTYHWFTGAGMAHGVRLREGRAEWYRSRFVMNARTAAAFGQPPIPGPSNGDGAVNTNLTVFAGRTYALVEAGSLPIELDYELESRCRGDFDGTLQGGFTAHPKRDPLTGETVAITYQPGVPFLRYVHLDKTYRARTLAAIPAPHGPLVHDVGFTKNYLVVLDLPVTFQPSPDSKYPYRWNAGQEPRIGLLPRSGELSGLRWFAAPSCFVFHILNAYEPATGQVIVDVVRHPRTFDADQKGINEGQPTLVRWTLDLATGALSESPLADQGCEFPRLNDQRGGQSYRYGYSARWGNELAGGPAQKHDVQLARTELHDFGPGRISLEPVFVPRAGAVDEDDGYVMAYVYDAGRNASDVVILAAQDFAGPPLAVIELPVRVPFGFHGNWAPDGNAGEPRNAKAQ